MTRRGKTKYDPLAIRRLADEYFENKANRPFSMLEVCEFVGIDYTTLHKWDVGADKVFSSLAKSIKQRVAACWEKGEVSPTLATFLMKTYMGYQEQAVGDFELRVRVIKDEC